MAITQIARVERGERLRLSRFFEFKRRPVSNYDRIVQWAAKVRADLDYAVPF